MSKENNLYFLKILIKAFERGGSDLAFRKALIEITKLGKQEGFREGFKQFNQFFEIGLGSNELSKEELIEKLIVGLATDSLDIDRDEQQSIIEKIKLNENLYNRFKQLSKEHKSSLPLEIDIYNNENLIGSHTISTKEDELIFTNIEPGNYSIGLSNGRVLWSGEVDDEDVIIDQSEENGEYSLAAETEETEIKPTRTIDLIKNEIKLYVYAGLEFGKFKIIIK